MRDLCDDKCMTNYASCAHDGQLINACDECIKKGFRAEFENEFGKSQFELNSRNCAIIRIAIDAFCARFENMFYATRFAEQIDIANIIRDEFGENAELIFEFCEIRIFG